MRALLLVIALCGLARADEEPEISFLPKVPAGLDNYLEPARFEARMKKIERGLAETLDVRARANLVLARADLWGSRALRERIHDRAKSHFAMNRAHDEYGKLFRDESLKTWPVMAYALYRFGYLLGLDDRHAAQFVYRRILAEHPQFEYSADVRVVIGDYDLERGNAESAHGEYAFAAKMASASTELRAYALYKRGWAELALARSRDALASFEAATQLSPRLGRMTRGDVVRAFADFGKPGDAHATFERLGRGDERELLARLAQYWADGYKAPEAIAIHGELLRRYPTDPRACRWQSETVRLVSHEREPVRFLAETERLVAVFARVRDFDDDDVCSTATKQLTFETALALVANEAIEGDPAILADRLLALFLHTFPDDELAGVARRHRLKLRRRVVR